MKIKTERLTIKLLKSDKAALERIAKAEGEAMAVVIRRLIREAAETIDSQADEVLNNETRQ